MCEANSVLSKVNFESANSGNQSNSKIRRSVSKLLAAILVIELFGAVSASNAALPDPTFTVPVTPITANEQTPVQVFPGLSFVDSGTNYSGGWIEYAVDSSTSADTILFETATVASTTSESITVVGSTIFKGNGTTADPIGIIDGAKNGRNGNNLKVTFSNTFTNGGFSDNTSVTVGDVVSLSGWTAYKRRIKLAGGSTVDGFATPTDTTFPAQTDSSPNNDSVGANNSYTVNPSYASRTGGGYAVQLATNGGCDQGYCIIRGPYIVSNSPVYLQTGDSVSFWWSALGASDAYDVYGYLLNTADGSTIKLLDATGANGAATQAWTQVTKTIGAGETGSYKFVFIAGTWDASGGQAEGASLLLDDVSVTASAVATISAANLRDLSRLLKYSVTNDAPQLSRTLRISTNNGAVDGVQTINITPVNDPIALQDPGTITRLRDMSDSSTATGIFVAYDPDTATVTPVPAIFTIVGGTDDTATPTNTLVGTYGNLSVETATGNYSYIFTTGALGADSYETFTVTAFDGIDTATGQLRIRLLQTLPVGSSTPRTISFTSPSPMAISRIYGETFTVTAAPSAGANDGTITYSAGSSTACSVSGNTVTITAGTGTCSISATISAGSTYATATTSTSVTVTVSKRQITINGLSQEMVFNQGSPNLGAYELIGSLAGSDAISVTGVRQQSIITGDTPIAISVTFTSGSAANYQITVNSGALLVRPANMSAPSFGELTRELGGFTVVLRNYNPGITNVISVSEGTATLVGPVDGIYKIVVTGITSEVNLSITASQPGFNSETASIKGGPLYRQVVSMDLSSLNQTQVGLSRNLKELATIQPLAEGLTFTSLTPTICEIKLGVLVEVLSEGTCQIRATANPSAITVPGAFAISSFTSFKKPIGVAPTATPKPTPTPTPTQAATPKPTPSLKPTTAPVKDQLIIPFEFAKFAIPSTERAKLNRLLLPKGVTVQVVGYAQRNNNQPDLGISLDRALEVRKAILKINPTAKVTVIGMGNKRFAPCTPYMNKCAVIQIRS
jgi:hypothetical protein